MSIPALSSGTPSNLSLSRPCASATVWDFLCVLVLLGLEDSVGVIHPFWLWEPSHLLFTIAPWVLSQGGGLLKTSYLVLTVPKYLTLCTLTNSFLFLSILTYCCYLLLPAPCMTYLGGGWWLLLYVRIPSVHVYKGYVQKNVQHALYLLSLWLERSESNNIFLNVKY